MVVNNNLQLENKPESDGSYCNKYAGKIFIPYTAFHYNRFNTFCHFFPPRKIIVEMQSGLL